jgi:hypothetical protein
VARSPGSLSSWLSLWLCACVRHGDASPDPQSQPAVQADPVSRAELQRAGDEVEREGAEPEPEPTPEAPAETSVFEPATRGEGSCRVTVVALLEAAEYRGGGPITPALEASLSADPDYARMYNSHSHGDHHIQCHYEVSLAHLPGKRWRWRVVRSNTLRKLSPEICKSLAIEVADDIIQTTKSCTSLDAGAYWGYVLEPIH